MAPTTPRDSAQFLTVPDGTPTTSHKQRPWSTYFLDLSNNNGSGVNLREIAHNSRHTGITGTELKASEGVHFIDPFFDRWRNDCRRWGLRMMPYHFARPDLNPGIKGAQAEADFFCHQVSEIRPAEWRPMLDAETFPNQGSWHRAWCERVFHNLGVAPVFYSYWSFIEGMNQHVPIGDGLIFAYPNNQPGVAPCPPPWKRWLAHQYSWHGTVAGVPGEVDLNWTRNVLTMLAHPVIGGAYEPVYAARRRRA